MSASSSHPRNNHELPLAGQESASAGEVIAMRQGCQVLLSLNNEGVIARWGVRDQLQKCCVLLPAPVVGFAVLTLCLDHPPAEPLFTLDSSGLNNQWAIRRLAAQYAE